MLDNALPHSCQSFPATFPLFSLCPNTRSLCLNDPGIVCNLIHHELPKIQLINIIDYKRLMMSTYSTCETINNGTNWTLECINIFFKNTPTTTIDGLTMKCIFYLVFSLSNTFT